jgi:hypothetical protein
MRTTPSGPVTVYFLLTDDGFLSDKRGVGLLLQNRLEIVHTLGLAIENDRFARAHNGGRIALLRDKLDRNSMDEEFKRRIRADSNVL